METVFILFLLTAFAFIKMSQIRDWATNMGAPFEPLGAEVVERVIKLANITPGEIFYDLGSGDGRVVIAAANKGARAVGVEYDFFRCWYSRFWIWFFKVHSSAKIVRNDIFEQKVGDADIVFTYLLPETNEKLYPKLISEMKPGARIVSAAFSYPKMKPEKIDPFGPVYGPIYLYVVGNNQQDTTRVERKT